MTAEGLVEEVTTAAAFGDPEIHVIDTTLVLNSAQAMWRGMVGNPVTGSLLGRCDTAELDQVKRAVLSAFEDRSGGPDRPLVLTASCNVLVARRVA